MDAVICGLHWKVAALSVSHVKSIFVKGWQQLMLQDHSQLPPSTECPSGFTESPVAQGRGARAPHGWEETSAGLGPSGRQAAAVFHSQIRGERLRLPQTVGCSSPNADSPHMVDTLPLTLSRGPRGLWERTTHPHGHLHRHTSKGHAGSPVCQPHGLLGQTCKAAGARSVLRGRGDLLWGSRAR